MQDINDGKRRPSSISERLCKSAVIAKVEAALKAESPPGVARLEARFESLILGINVATTERSTNEI